MASMGQRIKNRRIEMGLSVDELAKRLGKNRATVYRYESDYIENLPVTVVGPLADALQCSPAYLMGWEDRSPWTAQFLETLKRRIDISDPDDSKACGLNLDMIQKVISGDLPLTFERACDIVDALGESFDFMLGRDAEETVKSALDNENGLDRQIIALFQNLSPEKKRQALGYLQGLADSSSNQ